MMDCYGRDDFAKNLAEHNAAVEDSPDTTHWVHPEWMRERYSRPRPFHRCLEGRRE